jgi:hypothetical protein
VTLGSTVGSTLHFGGFGQFGSNGGVVGVGDGTAPGGTRMPTPLAGPKLVPSL